MRNRMVEQRARLGLSQKKLARILGVTRQTIISVENGKHDPSLSLAFNMATVFGCTVDELFQPEPWQPLERR